MAAEVPQLALSESDRARLEGAEGPALSLAMSLIVRAGEILGAERLIDVSFAHIDACHYNGQAPWSPRSSMAGRFRSSHSVARISAASAAAIASPSRRTAR